MTAPPFFAKKMLDGNIRPGTLGALSIELLAHVVAAFRPPALLMDQVGLEPTTSRVSGEVTLSYTTSNLVANSQPLPSRPLRLFRSADSVNS
ncbi:MAG: hypothetical protein WCA41_08840, partial [Candidatus Acidiferrum sp.]